MVKLIKLHNVTLEYANNKNGILLDVCKKSAYSKIWHYWFFVYKER